MFFYFMLLFIFVMSNGNETSRSSKEIPHSVRDDKKFFTFHFQFLVFYLLISCYTRIVRIGIMVFHFDAEKVVCSIVLHIQLVHNNISLCRYPVDSRRRAHFFEPVCNLACYRHCLNRKLLADICII